MPPSDYLSLIVTAALEGNTSTGRPPHLDPDPVMPGDLAFTCLLSYQFPPTYQRPGAIRGQFRKPALRRAPESRRRGGDSRPASPRLSRWQIHPGGKRGVVATGCQHYAGVRPVIGSPIWETASAH
jgi:hypothetical protein